MPNLSGKVIAITGAASGIGRATAHQVVEYGCTKLALADINIKALHEVVRSIKDAFSTHELDILASEVDVKSSSSVDNWINSVVSHFSCINGCVNLAGVVNEPNNPVIQKIADMTDEHWKFILDVNVTGMFNSLRAELRVLGQGASIVNAASTAALRPAPGMRAYSASKCAVVGLTISAAKEVGESGIRVNAICPGLIDTPMVKNLVEGNEAYMEFYIQKAPLKRLGKPEEVAKTIIFLLSDDSSWINGQTVTIDGGSF